MFKAKLMDEVYIGRIVECFDLSGRGRVAVVEIDSEAPIVRVKDKLWLRLLNGETLTTNVKSIELVCRRPLGDPQFDRQQPLQLTDIELLYKNLLRDAQLYATMREGGSSLL